MIEKAKQLVTNLLKHEDSGHGMDHINRVYNLAMKFAETENCNNVVTALGALLHDVDDYKLFGYENAVNLTNTKNILSEIGADTNTTNAVLDIISNMGYSKALRGIRPSTIEGMIVSDADMCDVIGANGILRTHIYSFKFNKDFFNKDLWPIENMSAEIYANSEPSTSMCHIFEKCLRVRDIMMTNSGKAEAQKRHEFMFNFLQQYFEEENAPEWQEYLKKYI